MLLLSRFRLAADACIGFVIALCRLMLQSQRRFRTRAADSTLPQNRYAGKASVGPLMILGFDQTAALWLCSQMVIETCDGDVAAEISRIADQWY